VRSIIECPLYCVFPRLASCWVSRHDLLGAQLHNLLETNRYDFWLLLAQIYGWTQPWGQVFLETSGTTIEIKRPSPDVDWFGRRILGRSLRILARFLFFETDHEPLLQFAHHEVVDGIVEMNRGLTLKPTLASIQSFFPSNSRQHYQKHVDRILPSFIGKIIDVHPCCTLSGVCNGAS
jgi:hypothetical protein